MPRVILFDFDLTLADSAAAVVECANHALRSMNFPARPSEEIMRTIGLPPRATFPIFTGEADPVRADQYLKHWVARADQITLSMVTIYEPVPAMLAELRRLGFQTGIVSTRYRYRIEAILTHRNLPRAVDVIVGGEDVASHKPDPEGITLALAKLGLQPADAIYVGDHAVDVQAARNAGVEFIGVLTGQSTRESFTALGAHRVIDSLAELPGLISG